MTGERKTYRSQLLPLRHLLSQLSVKRKVKQESAPPDGSLQLLDLPEELLICILSYLPFKSLISYRSISHAFNILITQSTSLQYAIALETHRFIHNLNSSLPLSERLRLLQAREESWRSLKPNLIQSFEVPHHASWVHDLNGGMFLLGDSVTGQKVIASNTSEIWVTKAVRCLVLQSLGYFTVGLTNTWQSFDLGRDILNAGMAIQEHDLIALVTMRPDNPSRNTLSAIEIQLLEFSTGNLHPFATLPSLLVTRSKQEAGRPGVNFEILGRHLAILVVYGTLIPDVFDQFVLFDWKKGTIIMSSRLPFGAYDSLTFLTAQILLLSNIQDGSFDIFHIPSVTFTDSHPFIRACSFVLPRLRSSFYYRTIYCRTDPKISFTSYLHHDNDDQDPHPNSTPPTPVLPHAQKPFYPSPFDSIVLFHICVQNANDTAWGNNGMRVYSLIVHRQSLLALVPPLSHARSRIVPWKDWGPRCSRLLDSHDIPTRMITACAGERYVRLAPDRHIHLLDFNPHHVRVQLACARTAAENAQFPSARGESASVREREGRSSVQVVHGKTVLEHGGEANPWRKKLYSELPYVLTVSNDVYRIGGVVMDEERIIGLRLKVKDRITSIRVLHFG